MAKLDDFPTENVLSKEARMAKLQKSQRERQLNEIFKELFNDLYTERHKIQSIVFISWEREKFFRKF